MALPIKSKDTQEGCNPVSSNCVIWQGPDIPCINLCKGDSVSDVVAKLAERLCDITNQLDISLLDLSCFNPLCPTVTDLQDLLQFILNKICALENPEVDPTKSSDGCPDDCIVTIAPCFQEADFLGNIITTLSLKDYVIKVGNEICTIISTVNTQQTSIQDLEERVTEIENTCCDNTPTPINILTSGCVGNNVNQPIQSFVTLLETAFCNLQNITTGNNLIDAQALLSNLCLNGTEDQLNQLPSSVPLSSIPGWFPAVNNISQALNNLYLAVCDIRTYIENTIPSLVDTVAECCGVSCLDIRYSVAATAVVNSKFIQVSLPGDPIPPSFTYCPTLGANKIVVENMSTTQTYFVSVGTNDVIDAINNGTFVNSPTGLDLTSGGGPAEESVAFRVCVDLCLESGDLTCSSTRCTGIIPNTSYCSLVNPTISTTPTTPTEGTITLNWTNPSPTLTTPVTIQVYYNPGSGNVPYGSPVSLPSGTTSYTSGDLPAGSVYSAGIKFCQTSVALGTQCIECTSGSVFVTGTP